MPVQETGQHGNVAGAWSLLSRPKSGDGVRIRRGWREDHGWACQAKTTANTPSGPEEPILKTNKIKINTMYVNQHSLSQTQTPTQTQTHTHTHTHGEKREEVGARKKPGWKMVTCMNVYHCGMLYPELLMLYLHISVYLYRCISIYIDQSRHSGIMKVRWGCVLRLLDLQHHRDR